MKRLVTTAALLAGLVSSASAVEVWQGDLFITTANATCRENGVNVNDFVRAVYRPANVSDNGPDARLSLVGTRNAQRYSFTGVLVDGGGSYNGQIISSTANYGTWSDTYQGAKVRPVTPAVTTPTVTFKIVIKQYATFAGCNVTLSGSLGHRPGTE
jgi:hypothetical protein